MPLLLAQRRSCSSWQLVYEAMRLQDGLRPARLTPHARDCDRAAFETSVPCGLERARSTADCVKSTSSVFLTCFAVFLTCFAVFLTCFDAPGWNGYAGGRGAECPPNDCVCFWSLLNHHLLVVSESWSELASNSGHALHPTTLTISAARPLRLQTWCP